MPMRLVSITVLKMSDDDQDVYAPVFAVGGWVANKVGAVNDQGSIIDASTIEIVLNKTPKTMSEITAENRFLIDNVEYIIKSIDDLSKQTQRLVQVENV